MSGEPLNQITTMINEAGEVILKLQTIASSYTSHGLTPATGGPNNDGMVPWTDGVVTRSIPSLAKLQQDMKKGDTGPQGVQGIKGDKGNTGDKGATGNQGIQGLKGDKGDTGSQGIQGVKGDTGTQGIQGLKGDKGDKGDTGATGPAGSVSNVPWSAITDKPTTLVTTDVIPVFTGGRSTSDGGEIRLAKPASGTTLAGDIVIDAAGDAIRFFESGGNARGAHIPLSAMANSASARIWTSSDFGLTTFADRFHGHAIADVSGLQAALNAKAPTAGPTFTGTATFNGVAASSVSLNTGLLYPDGNHTVLKTGATGSEKYWRADANGTLYALSGGFDASGSVRSSASVIVGPNDGAANSTTMGPGYMEMRSQALGAYIDLSNNTATAMDFGGRLQYAGTNLTISNGAGGNIVIGSGNVLANSSDGAQSGRVLTQDGGEQVVTKNLAYLNVGNDDFHVTPAAGLEVRGKGGNTAAMMRFHRPGAFGVQLGLGTDNQMRVGGWSLGTVSYRLWTEQNFDPTNFTGDTINGGAAGLTVSGAGGINVTSSGGIKSTGSGGFTGTNLKLSSGDGNGVKFWNGNDSYSITMGSAAWGGRIGGETTSDYNMYLRMDGGTNRGFVFKNGATPVAGIDAGGYLRTLGSAAIGGEVYCANWFRVVGASQGIYWEQHGGGWHMTDTTYMRAYNGKNVYTSGFMQAGNIKLGQNVDVGVYSDVSNMAYRTPHASGTHYLQSNGGSKTYMIVGDGAVDMYRNVNMNGGYITFGNVGLNNGVRFPGGRDMRMIQKANNWIHWTNESDGYEIAGLDYAGNFNTRSSITSPSITATSDRSLKHEIVALEGALELVSRIKPSRFKWNMDGRQDIGVIAQELEEDLPEAVRTNDDGMKSVNYNALTVVNTAAIQAMMQELAALRSDVQEMKGRLH